MRIISFKLSTLPRLVELPEAGDPATFDNYFQPGGTDYYKRPDGTFYYKRP